MLVYRSDTEQRAGAAVWQEILRQAAALTTCCQYDDALSFLIAFGEAESAIVDRLCPERDGVHPHALPLRRASVAAAHVVLAAAQQDRTAEERHIADIQRCLASVSADTIPPTLSMSVSEGYAYYALHPDNYVEAARRFVAECRPLAATVIGIRSIGTSLSAVVAAAVEETGTPAASWTVRPHGHPFDRHVTLADTLAREFRSESTRKTFLVIDEGPGLSGSSFAAVVTALTDLGVAPHAILLFPSWNPDGSEFKSETARTIWQRQRRYCTSNPAAPPHESSVRFAWRELLYSAEAAWPATHPQHERVKWLDARASRIDRFAGLGHYGHATRRRAEMLAAAGLGPAPIELRNGYLTLPFVEGRPCTPGDASPPLIDALAAHVAGVARVFPGGRRPGIDTLQHMIETNVRLGLGDAALPAATLGEDERRALEDAPCAAIDARMLTHEWICTPTGFTKVDALDHHADHFFPGTQDAAWDLAAAAVEFELPADGRERLIDAYVRASGDGDVRRRLRFHERAYLAFRLGYTMLARDTLASTAEAARFDALARSYAVRLRRTLRPTPS